MKVTLTDAQRMLHILGFLPQGMIGMPEDPVLKRAVATFQAQKMQIETGNVRGLKFLAELFQLDAEPVEMTLDITEPSDLPDEWWIGLTPSPTGRLPTGWWLAG